MRNFAVRRQQCWLHHVQLIARLASWSASLDNTDPRTWNTRAQHQTGVDLALVSYDCIIRGCLVLKIIL